MITPTRALVFGLSASAALAGAAHAETIFYYDFYSGRPVMIYTPGYGSDHSGAPVVVAPAPPIDADPAPAYRMEYHYVPPGLSITTPLGTYAPFYGGWNPYSHEMVGGYDGYRHTGDR